MAASPRAIHSGICRRLKVLSTDADEKRRLAYAANSDAGVVAIIDTKTDKIVKTLKVGEQPWRAYNSPDGRWMLVPNNGDSTVSVIDTTSQKIVAQLNAGTEMTGINYALGGSKAYVISRGDSMVYVYDMKTFSLVTRLKIGLNLALETAATTADGTKIYLASSSNDSVYVIDARTDQVKQIAEVGRYPWGVSILARPAQIIAIRRGARMPAVMRPVRPYRMCLGVVSTLLGILVGGCVHPPTHDPVKAELLRQLREAYLFDIDATGLELLSVPEIVARLDPDTRLVEVRRRMSRLHPRLRAGRLSHGYASIGWRPGLSPAGLFGAGRWRTCGRRSAISSHHSVP